MRDMKLHLRGVNLITCDPSDRIILNDLLISDGLIEAFLPHNSPPHPGATVIELAGRWLVPGFVQAHIHLVQTLFRGLADDLALLDWLRQRIWPLERAHDPESIYWSARLGITELLLGGTTAVLDMATVHHTDSVFQAAGEAGIRASIGNAMMDRDNEAGLGTTTDAALAEAERLRARWHGEGNLAFSYAPRFVPSCSEPLLRETVALARQHGCQIHTHASENRDEVEMVKRMTGRDNVRYLHDIGMTGPDVVLAHCIHLTEAEIDILAKTNTTLTHCPGSNCKLASGLARVPELRARGIRWALGADGAPCNNRMDIFAEMRLAALLQKPRLGAETMTATEVLRMATTDGATALGLNAGSIEVGRQADLVVLDPDLPHSLGGGDPRSAIVYAMTPANVTDVFIGGKRVVQDRAVVGWSTAETVTQSKAALVRVRQRAGL